MKDNVSIIVRIVIIVIIVVFFHRRQILKVLVLGYRSA